MAKVKPANIAHFAPVRSMRCRSANGAVITAPPKFRQNTRVKIGIALKAINGPEVPMARIPILMRIKSGRAGILVWLSLDKGCDIDVTVADTLRQ